MCLLLQVLMESPKLTKSKPKKLKDYWKSVYQKSQSFNFTLKDFRHNNEQSQGTAFYDL